MFLRMPIAHRDDDIAFHALWPGGLGMGKLSLGDPVGPVAEIFIRHAGKLAGKLFCHVLAGLTRLGPSHPALFAGSELMGDGAGIKAADLVAADAASVLDDVEIFALLDLSWNIALATELVLAGNFQHRIPVDRRIILRGGGLVGRRYSREVLRPARSGPHLWRVDQPVTAYPDFVIGGRQVGQHIAALIVGHDGLDIPGAEIPGFGDDPDAAFGTVRAGDGSANIVIVDSNPLSQRCIGSERRTGCNRDSARCGG